MKNPLTGAYVFLSGEVNEACLELNLRNHDGRHEKLLTMRLYFLSLFHNNTTKGYHSCDKFIYPLYNDRLQARQFAWVSDCLSLTSDSKIYTTEKSGADPSKKSNRPQNIRVKIEFVSGAIDVININQEN